MFRILASKSLLLAAFLLSLVLHFILFNLISQREQPRVIIPNMVQANSANSLRVNFTVVEDVVPKKTIVKKKLKTAQKAPIIKKQEIPQEIKPNPPKLKETQKDKEPEKQKPILAKLSLRGKRVSPIYPSRSLRLGQEGIVKVGVIIDEKGVLQEINIVQTSGYRLLDKAALTAIRSWKFNPHQLDGKYVPSRLLIPIEFKIN